MDGLTVGQMAELNNVSEQTLRLYDQKGLLRPLKRGANNQYRYYDIKQSAVLDMIRYMKALGMTLEEIKENLDTKNGHNLKNILYTRKDQIQEEIRQLQVQDRAIDRHLDAIRRYQVAPPDATIILEQIDCRYMYCIDTEINFYNRGLEFYEAMLRKLLQSLSKDNLPFIYFSNAGTILRQENVCLKRFYSTEVFVFVDQECTGKEWVTKIPANNYLCIYCDNYYKEKDYAAILFERIRQEGYEICGDYLCETLADLPLIEKGERDMFLRLQVPVKLH